MFQGIVRKWFGVGVRGHRSQRRGLGLQLELLESRITPTAEFNGPMSDWINVKTDSRLTLHAVGDGVTDDTAALQGALNFAVSDPAYSTTGTIYIPTGTYKVTGTLWVWGGQSIHVYGADPTTTTISWAGVSGGSVFHFNGSRDSTVARLNLEGNNTAGDLLFLDWDKTISPPTGVYTSNGLQYGGPNMVADVYFKDAQLGIQGSSGIGANQNLAVAETSIERCQFTNTHNGVFVDSFNALDWWIEGCTFTNNDGAIGTFATTGTNPANWNSGAGDFKVSDSVFSHSTTADFVVGNLAGPILIKNCFSTGSNQFMWEYGPWGNGYNITIQGTTILDPTTNAIFLHNFTPLTLLDNTFRTTTAPIYLNQSWETEGYMAAAQVLAVGNQYSMAAGTTFTGANRQMVSVGEQFGVNLSGISSTPPPPVAALPYVSRPVIALTPGASGTDMTATIQNAINTAVTNYSGQRPIVYLAAGQYDVSSTLVVPANSDVQIIGDSSWVQHGTELIWTGASGGTVLELQGPSHAVLRDFSLFAQSTAGTLIQVDNADQAGARVFADRFGDDGAITGYGVWSDQLDNTQVQLLNSSGPEGVKVTGGPIASTTGTAAGSTVLEYSAGSSNTTFTDQYSVSNGGNLFLDGIWWEGQANTPLFDLSGSGHLTVASMMLGYYANSTAANSVELHNFNGTATFLNVALSHGDPTKFTTATDVLADGSAPTQVLLADSSSGMTQPLTNNLTNTSANAVALANILASQGGGAVPSANEGTYTAAWLQSMLATVMNTPPLQDPTSDLAAGMTDVQLYNVSTWNGGTTGLHIEGAQTGVFPTSTDVGGPTPAGSASFDGTTYTVKGGGTDIYNGNNQFQFDYQNYTGDGTIVAKLTGMTDTSQYAKAGVMFRADTTAGAVFADIVQQPLSGSPGLFFQWRTAAGGAGSQYQLSNVTDPVWVKLVRSGSDFSAYYSYDGVNWTQLGSTVTITAMPTNALLGLAVCSNIQGTLCTATFTNVSVNTPAAPSALSATAVSNSQVDLSWTINSSNQTGFKVERATDSGFTQNLTLLTTTTANSWTYTDTTAAPGTTYYYRVRATNNVGDSADSARASAQTYAVATPTGLSATIISTSQINLTWTAPSGTISGYNIYRGSASNGESLTPLNSTLIPAGTTSYSDTTAQPMNPYYYVVEAVSASGTSANSNEATVVTRSTNPPTNVTATAASTTQINVSWTAVSGSYLTPFYGYNVYRGTTPGGESGTPLNGGTYITGTSFSDTTATPGTTYYYTVVAETRWSASVSSNEASALTPTAPPTGLSATTASSTQVNLTWTAPSGIVSGYNVYRGTTSGGESTTPLNITLITGTSFSDTTASPGITYYYTVVAVNAGGASGKSNEASAQAGLFTTAADIGGPSPTGSSAFDGTTYTIKGGGSDIWNGNNQFQFDYKSSNGDGSIVARVASITNTNSWAKAGVMFRASNAANAVYADVVVTPGNGIAFQWRTSAGGSGHNVQVTGKTAPQWVKLVRSGSNFSAYYSSDGTTWTQIGSTVSITAMPTADLVGLAVTSHAQGTLCTATFTNVSISSDPQAIIGQQPETPQSNGFVGFAGFTFTPNTDLTVTQLGLWADGQVGRRTVEIVDATTGQVLAAVVIDPTDASGMYVYGRLSSPLLLTAGHTYDVLTEVTSSDTYHGDGTAVSSSADLTVDGSVLWSGHGKPKVQRWGSVTAGLVNFEYLR